MDKIILGESKLFPGKSHSNMLLDMCSDLIGDCIWNDENNCVRFNYKDRTEDISWLEICISQLPKAMSNPNNRAWDISIRVVYHIHEFYYHHKHPVDYLYGEYMDKKVWNKSKNY